MICPKCGSDAVYKYGFSRSGKQRYQCQICFFQFVENPSRRFCPERPVCPVCGAPMYIHNKRGDNVTYRCSQYPGCKGYVSNRHS